MKHFFFLLGIILLVSNIRNVLISPVGLGQFACFFIALASALYIVTYVCYTAQKYIGYRRRIL